MPNYPPKPNVYENDDDQPVPPTSTEEKEEDLEN